MEPSTPFNYNQFDSEEASLQEAAKLNAKQLDVVMRWHKKVLNEQIDFNVNQSVVKVITWILKGRVEKSKERSRLLGLCFALNLNKLIGYESLKDAQRNGEVCAELLSRKQAAAMKLLGLKNGLNSRGRETNESESIGDHVSH